MVSNLSLRSKLLVCTGLAAISLMPVQALADQAPASTDAAAAYEPAAGDIIVTARRSDEKLQDVPESVQAISGSALVKLSITSANELSKLSPGLTLQSAGSSTAVVLRGVTWEPGSGTPATPIYYNEVPFDPANTITSLFDIGQVEVLRGPQGTSRGAPSISGAVTITTHKPNLHEFGGYVQGQYGEANHFDIQGALNIPIVKDMLALRLAANIENSEDNRVYSVHNPAKPKFTDRSYRGTLLFQPTDRITIEGMYQTRRTRDQYYVQVAGTGSPGYAALAIPANFNGPALSVANRASVEDQRWNVPQHIDLATINASWDVLAACRT